ncbi:MAG: D-2-hydroxyacid dehydrogenase [Lachnospiraceae bacterium]|nr:D-2-hydroxyacid dehydrogenase [Lachnospiraceae bacterium]
MTTVLITRPFKETDLSRFSSFEGKCRFLYDAAPSRDILLQADVILGQPVPDSLKDLPDLKWVQITSAGANNYTDRKELFGNGLKLTCLSGAFGQSISEFVLTMTLMLYKNMQLYRDNQNQSLWKDEGPQETPVGKNLLILGAGNIGSEIAKLFRPFRTHITGMRRVVREIPENFDEMITSDGLDEALPKADIIACALPETPETIKMLDERRLSLMKPSAILINVGRGTLIDTDAVLKALRENRLFGAALDVTDPEPLPADHPLWQEKKAIITPHTTGGSFGHLKATEEVLFDICQKNLQRYLEGEPLLNLVDPETGYRVVENRY